MSSISKLSVIFELLDLKMVPIENIRKIRNVLTLFWHTVTFLLYSLAYTVISSLITDEIDWNWKEMPEMKSPLTVECTNPISKDLDYVWHVNDGMQLFFFVSQGNVSSFSWIINEEFVKLRNKCQKWIPRPEIHTHTSYYADWINFDMEMTGCHFPINI